MKTPGDRSNQQQKSRTCTALPPAFLTRPAQTSLAIHSDRLIQLRFGKPLAFESREENSKNTSANYRENRKWRYY